MLRTLLTFTILLSVLAPVKAGVIVEKSRVIFPAEKLSQNVKILNSNNYPVICKVWVDEGIPTINESSLIVVKKPFFKMNANEKNTLTLLNLDMENTLPLDREYLYWLNIEEIPPKNKNYLQNDILISLVMHTQLKIFVRPDNLKITPATAHKNQSFKLLIKNDRSVLHIANASPYYVTYSDITIKTPSGNNRSVYSGMIAPYSNEKVSVSNIISKGSEITYSVISDHGFLKKYSSLII